MVSNIFKFLFKKVNYTITLNLLWLLYSVFTQSGNDSALNSGFRCSLIFNLIFCDSSVTLFKSVISIHFVTAQQNERGGFVYDNTPEKLNFQLY